MAGSIFTSNFRHSGATPVVVRRNDGFLEVPLYDEHLVELGKEGLIDG